MIQNVERKIKQAVSASDYTKGLVYDEDSVTLQSIDERKDSRVFHFMIRSEHTYRFYRAEIVIENNDIARTFCTCPQFIATHSCKHVAASCILFSHELFIDGKENRFLIQSKNFLSKNAGKLQPKIKKRLSLEIHIETEEYYDFEYNITLKIGDTHFYTVRNKFYDFMDAYYNSDVEVEFGKFLTYSSNLYYFNKEDESILEFLFSLFSSSYSIHTFQERDLKELLKLLEQKPFFLNNQLITKIEKNSPIHYYLTQKEDGLYHFFFDEITPLTKDYSYIIKDQTCYLLPSKERKLLKDLKEERLTEILFEKEDLNNFEKAILPVVKHQIQLDENIKELQLIKEPGVRLYFDFEDVITCNLCFLYGNEEISCFEKKENILRDLEFENQVFSDLYAYSFQITNRKIWLEDIDFIGDFLEHGLEELSRKYEVFTSSKIKNTKILKNQKVISTFSIGKDNIMNYTFELEEASKKDLENILSSLKQKKKYYKMKNGNVLSLKNKEFEELEQLKEELDLDMNGGVIPKYRALYLDSIKEKYHIIQTDDLFGKFIENFKNYHNLELSFQDTILREYQKIGVKWLYHIYKCDFGGILADEMGLGKSIQVIYFIKELLKENKKNKVLIVVPTSLVYNWKNEFDKFGSSISYMIVSGTKKTRKKMLDSEVNVYITSYGLLREDIEWYEEKHFQVCIIDEAQNIKNMTTGITKAVKKVPSDTRFALTGTPIENSALELYSIFDFIMPGFLGSFLSFQRKYKIKEFDEHTSQMLTGLNQIISPFLLRRKKNDVMKDLPPKLENNIFIDLNEPQRKLYAAQVEFIKKEMDRLIEEEGFKKANFLILKLLTRLRQLCIDPKIMFEDYKGGSSKIEELMKVVKETILNGHKILLFTSFKSAFEIIKQELEKEQITFYQIDGSVPSKRRMELVQKFNQDDTNLFLITLKAGGTGLNLTSADVVIHLDLWWNPQAENQATDRAHRIGQSKVVQVIKLISRGTIEERILELQTKKKELSDKIIEGENRNQNLLSSLTEEDIRHLLSFENKED